MVLKPPVCKPVRAAPGHSSPPTQPVPIAHPYNVLPKAPALEDNSGFENVWLLHSHSLPRPTPVPHLQPQEEGEPRPGARGGRRFQRAQERWARLPAPPFLASHLTWAHTTANRFGNLILRHGVTAEAWWGGGGRGGGAPAPPRGPQVLLDQVNSQKLSELSVKGS